jgi:hypothetical protein
MKASLWVAAASPRSEDLERKVGSDETGWLFR